MPSIYDEFPSAYIKTADVDPAQGGRPARLTIQDYNREDVSADDDKVDEKPTLGFRGTDKRLTLNRTRADDLVAVFGTADYTEWLGRQFELYAAQTRYMGQPVMGMRCRAVGAATGPTHPVTAVAQQPEPEPAAQGELPRDDIPF